MSDPKKGVLGTFLFLEQISPFWRRKSPVFSKLLSKKSRPFFRFFAFLFLLKVSRTRKETMTKFKSTLPISWLIAHLFCFLHTFSSFLNHSLLNFFIVPKKSVPFSSSLGERFSFHKFFIIYFIYWFSFHLVILTFGLIVCPDNQRKNMKRDNIHSSKQTFRVGIFLLYLLLFSFPRIKFSLVSFSSLFWFQKKPLPLFLPSLSSLSFSRSKRRRITRNPLIHHTHPSSIGCTTRRKGTNEKIMA